MMYLESVERLKSILCNLDHPPLFVTEHQLIMRVWGSQYSMVFCIKMSNLLLYIMLKVVLWNESIPISWKYNSMESRFLEPPRTKVGLKSRECGTHIGGKIKMKKMQGKTTFGSRFGKSRVREIEIPLYTCCKNWNMWLICVLSTSILYDVRGVYCLLMKLAGVCKFVSSGFVRSIY